MRPSDMQVSHLAQLRKAHKDNISRSDRAELDRMLAQTEHFVFTAVPVDHDEEIEASHQAMREAGVWHLPFPVCTFEFDAEIKVEGIAPRPGRAERFILVCRELADEPHTVFLFCRAHQHLWMRIPLAVASARGYHDTEAITFEAPQGHLAFNANNQGHAIGTLGVAFLVLLATRGIPRERWAGDRPVLKHRPEPRDAYTKVLVREASEAQGHRDAPGGGTDRCRVRLHLRRGHIRHQPVGPRSAGQTRMIWIAPMLVGYAEEGTIEHSHYERRP